ncbi:MAG: EAL domain-containing protein [Acidobacteriota bacterium]|nr:EAL domain-containing protein [Acidobacteriota bacterium]
MSRQEFFRPYQWTVVAAGALITLWGVNRLPLAQLDLRFLLLALITVGISSRIAVKIPRYDTDITVSDTFIFLALLSYGGEAAVLLAAAEGVIAGFRISKKKKPVTILFNSALAASSTFAAVCASLLFFGATTELPRRGSANFLAALCVLGLTQYVFNSGMVAVGLALKTGQRVWQTWVKNCLWSSLTYFVGAALAGAMVNFFDSKGFYALLVAVPVIWAVYYTYDKYLEDIKATAAQAEQAERARAEAEHARAEAEHERAELAERHVEEQRHYIAELERVKKQLEESREHFRHAAFHDSLTGLPNRALLADHLRLSIERARRRADHLFAVLFLDLDRFKNINDSLGHAAGDRLLVEVARRLETCMRPTDTVARLGGDEFAVLLDGLDSNEDAVRVAERVQEELARPLYLDGHEVYTTASIGITICTAYYDDPENILRDADTAMYYAKENGKARYELFDAAMHASVVARLQLENDLRRAVENHEFFVHYQPIIALGTGRVAGFEALVRWRHPERGFVSPAEFIPLAEETGLIADIGDWVLYESCRQMSEWRRELPPHSGLTVSVNLSSKQFTQPDLIGRIAHTLRETGLPPQFLKLEITESAVMDNAEVAALMLIQLREKGIQLSIDDFGTGYSSLSYLHRFPVDTLKIDRSFVGRMGEGGENTEIVRTIVTLASNLGMAVIAEGVETREQHEQLNALKCEYGQGYLYSRPVDADAALALIRESQRAQIPPFDPHVPEQTRPRVADMVAA